MFILFVNDDLLDPWSQIDCCCSNMPALLSLSSQHLLTIATSRLSLPSSRVGCSIWMQLFSKAPSDIRATWLLPLPAVIVPQWWRCAWCKLTKGKKSWVADFSRTFHWLLFLLSSLFLFYPPVFLRVRAGEMSWAQDATQETATVVRRGRGQIFLFCSVLDNKKGRDSVRWETKGKQHDKNNSTKIYWGSFPGRNN